MENNRYLNEEKNIKTKKKLLIVSIIILFIGVLLGGGLIAKGLSIRSEIKYRFSEENKAEVKKQYDAEKEKLENKKKELEDKVKPIRQEIRELERAEFNGFNDEYRERKRKIDELVEKKKDDEETIKLLDGVLYTISSWCDNIEKENELTADYCVLKEEYYNISEKRGEDDRYIPCFIGGGFLFIFFSMISFSIYSFAKARDIAAFTMQQGMPLMEEGVEKITSIHKKMVKEMAPVYGEVAKEVAKGVEKGKRQGNLVKCNNCGAPVEDDTDTCKYCKSKY